METIPLKKKNTLSPVDYWEWRASVEELQVAQLKHQNAEIEQVLLQKNTQIAKLEAKVQFLGKMQSNKSDYERIKSDYNLFIDKLEKKVGFGLKDTAINPITFEVEPLETKENKEDGSD